MPAPVVAKQETAEKLTFTGKKVEFPVLRDRRYPVHRIADRLEPYLRMIIQRFNPAKIILFGSYAYGEPSEHSDVDLLVIRDGIGSERESDLEIRAAFWAMERPLLPFTLITKTPAHLQDQLAHGSFFFREIMGRGVILYGA